MSEPLTLPPCRVCGGTATGIHYGVNTCEACKAFFRRSLVENNKYVCPRDGDCKIINHKRANCSACRLKKCIDLGMSKKAVRHGRYTVAIRTKTILEVKQLEREQALKDSFALADSFAKPEIISIPEETPEIISKPELTPSPVSSESIISSVIESSDFSPSIWESSNFSSNDSLQSSVVESSQMSVNGTIQSPIENCSMSSCSLVSLEPSSVFSSMDNNFGNDMFTRMDNLDILNTINLDCQNDANVLEISGSDVFLNPQNSQVFNIDLTSDKIDFLEINSDELIDLSHDVIDVFQMESTENTQGKNIQLSSPMSFKEASPSSVQQQSPDSTTLDESMSSQSRFTDDANKRSYPSSTDLTQMAQNQIPTSFNFSDVRSRSTSTSPALKKKLRSSFILAHDMETLQLINTLVSAQEILYPCMRKYFNKDFADIINREFLEKTQLHSELFGNLKTLSTSEYNSFFLATGIDVDGRMDMLTKAAECMQKQIVRYISFVKSIPGWENVHNSDKLTLIKASRFEYWLLGKFVHINPELGVTSVEGCGFTHKQIVQMWGSPDNIKSIHDFSKKLKNLDLTFEEIALLRGVVVLSRDRCALREPEVVEKIQWKILQSFIHLINKTHPHEPLRFARCMDKITQMRELTDLNYKANKNLENFQKSLIQNYPLLYECVTYEG